MDLSRSNFLDLLKGNNSTTTTTSESITNQTNEKNSNNKKNKKNNKKNNDNDNDSDNDEGHEQSVIGSTSWSVLKDSYLTDKPLALKVILFILLYLFCYNYILGLGSR